MPKEALTIEQFEYNKSEGGDGDDVRIVGKSQDASTNSQRQVVVSK